MASNYGKWTHVCVTVSGVAGSIVQYINGVAVGNVGTAVSGMSLAYLTLGYVGNGGSFNGAIDDVRIYNRVLNTFEIKMLST